jgi:hypothetical protein
MRNGEHSRPDRAAVEAAAGSVKSSRTSPYEARTSFFASLCAHSSNVCSSPASRATASGRPAPPVKAQLGREPLWASVLIQTNVACAFSASARRWCAPHTTAPRP